MLNEEMIKAAYHDLAFAKHALLEATDKEQLVKRDLKASRCNLINEPDSVTGKNEAQREACLYALTLKEESALVQAEQIKRVKTYEAEIALMQVQENRDLLKLFSLKEA
jgi:hypothetical protein